mgnify:CR=1 FL=1
MFAVSNNFSKNSVYAPVISMLMTISARQFSMQNRIPFVYFLDEMTTVNIKNFEMLPSVLREYKAAFVLLTQSGAKLENLYGKLDRSSVEANFGNMFLGRTKDVEALKYYPLFFGKEEKERRSRSSGKSGASSNSSVTVSSQKEDIYQGKDFADLEPGEFIAPPPAPTPAISGQSSGCMMTRRKCRSLMYGFWSREKSAGTLTAFWRRCTDFSHAAECPRTTCPFL